MIHSKMVKPRAFPWNSARDPEQINRLQEITGDLALNRDKLYEIGRIDLLDYRKRTPSFTGRFRQFEYGSMEFWYDLANVVTPVGPSHAVALTDLETTMIDVSTYLTDDNNTFTGTAWFPKLRVSGFTINIGDPDAMLERNFNVISEGAFELPGAYFAYQDDTVGLVGAHAMILSPVAVAYASGKYIFRVLRVRSGSVSQLVEDESLTPAADTWGFVSGTNTLTVQSCLVGDIIKCYYESATAYATTWADDDLDASVLLAEYCEVYMKVGTAERIYRLQSVGIDVTFTRTDYKEIGNNEVVQTGVKDKSVKISLNRFLEGFSLEEMLANDTSYPYINPADFSDNIQMMIKVFGEKEHTNFKIGYLMNKISPTALGLSQAVQDYLKTTTALEGDNLLISDVEADIVFS
jgi:hypothetical protein